MHVEKLLRPMQDQLKGNVIAEDSCAGPPFPFRLHCGWESGHLQQVGSAQHLHIGQYDWAVGNHPWHHSSPVSWNLVGCLWTGRGDSWGPKCSVREEVEDRGRTISCHSRCYNETPVMPERKNIVHFAWLQCFASGFVPPYRYGELIAGFTLSSRII
ncbi:hypothetical protein RB213_011169 [Colletotrichum asianum]